MHVDQSLTQLLDYRQRHAAAVDTRTTPTAAPGNFTTDDQRTIFRLQAVFVENSLQLRLGCLGHAEDALDKGPAGPALHDFGAKAVAQQRTDGVDQDRLAGTRLA